MLDAWLRILSMAERAQVSRQFLIFLLVGGTAAAAQWLSRFGFAMALPYGWALVAAYGVGLLVAFELNRRHVFPAAAGRLRGQFARFFLVNLVSLAVVWGVSMLLGSVLLPRVLPRDWAEALGHAIGILSPAVLSYLLHKHYTFRAERPAP